MKKYAIDYFYRDIDINRKEILFLCDEYEIINKLPIFTINH
jgi:hypothetical protein